MNKIIFTLLFINFIFLIPSWAIHSDQLVSKPIPENTIRVTVIFTNDVHGGIMRSEAEFLNPEFPPILGGAASAVKIIQAFRERAKRDGQYLLITDAGDIYQGAPIGTVTKGQAIVDYYNLIGLDWVTVGNHDLDHGYWNLDSMIQRSKFPWVACNLKLKNTNQQYPNTVPWIIRQLGDLKIGIIGLATASTKNMSFPKNIANIEFEDEITAIHRAIQEVRQQGAKSIWVTYHHGIMFNEEETFLELVKQEQTGNLKKSYISNAQELVHQVDGIDLMFCGHIHIGKPKGWVHPSKHTLMIQNYGHGGNIGVVDIYLDKFTGKIVKYDMPTENSMLLLLQEEQWGRDKEIDQKIQAIVDTVEKGLDDVIGESQIELIRGDANAPMVMLVATALKEYAKTDLAIQNAGGVRDNITPGLITKRHIFHIEPFGNELVTVTVNGKFLKELLESRVSKTRLGIGVSGVTILYNAEAPLGNRIQEITFDNGKKFHNDSLYTIATTDYLLMGNSGMSKFTEIPHSQVNWMGVRVSEAIVEYIQKNSPITKQTKRSWISVK
ncbi:MAG: bifunctional metallophosphatase/5'-nucleotidase [bacterium]|nr:bifunctional metallophosphatase/5'-nucleotidase [bacterium]